MISTMIPQLQALHKSIKLICLVWLLKSATHLPGVMYQICECQHYWIKKFFYLCYIKRLLSI